MIAAGCAHPYQANIKLRKENQQLQAKVASLQTELAAKNLPRVSTTQTINLAQGNFDSLFTVGSIQIKAVTILEDYSGVRVHVALTDDTGDKIKAVGSFHVQLFDLQKKGDQLIADANFTPQQARKDWTSFLTMYEYMLPVKWQSPPQHNEMTVRVTYVDELTQRKIDAQKVVKIELPPKK